METVDPRNQSQEFKVFLHDRKQFKGRLAQNGISLTESQVVLSRLALLKLPASPVQGWQFAVTELQVCHLVSVRIFFLQNLFDLGDVPFPGMEQLVNARSYLFEVFPLTHPLKGKYQFVQSLVPVPIVKRQSVPLVSLQLQHTHQLLCVSGVQVKLFS